MSLHGSIVVIAQAVDANLVRAIESAGASPVIGAQWPKAAGVVARVAPSAIIVGAAADPAEPRLIEQTARAIKALPLYTPVLASTARNELAAIPGVLPLLADASCERIVARLSAALEVRALHATVTRRASLVADAALARLELPEGDPLDDATVLVIGRGRSFPLLTSAVGERVGVIGALSVETAARYLGARDVDGMVIGESFGPTTLASFLTALSQDARFRDLPVALLTDPPARIDLAHFPNLDRLTGSPDEVVAALLPLVRQHAFAARLRRELASFETQGLIDARTGLSTPTAFHAGLTRAIEEAQQRDTGLSLARFAFPTALDRRISFDAARLVSRLVRSVDFGCRASDGSILVAFSATALRHAHVIARRIASVLRHTMLTPANGPTRQIDANVTLATLKATDTAESLLTRVCGAEPVGVISGTA